MAENSAPSESERLPEISTSGRLIQLDASESGAYSSVNTGRRRRRKRMPGLAMLPTALTLGNAICGIAALIELTKAFAAIGSDAGEVYLRLSYAALLIGAGMLFDALDGKVARMTATTGRFGAELDSLCDAITFGVVPAIMIRVSGEFFFASYDFDTKILWAVAALYACCAILRLARYNVETEDDDDHASFRGLPSPAAAASIAGFILALSWTHETFSWFAAEPWPWILRFALPIACVFIGLMMVTRVRYVHVFNRLVSRKQSLRTMVVFLVLLTVLWIFADYWRLTVPGLMLVYVFSGPMYFAYRFMRGRGLLGRRLAIAERKRRRDERVPKTN